MINATSKVAIVAGNRLGDGLILNLVHYNLVLNGYDVTFFNSPLLTLKDWFHWGRFVPHLEVSQMQEALKPFDTVIFQHPNLYHKIPPSYHAQQRLVFYGEPLFMQKKPLLDIYLETCRDWLNLPKVIRSNGLIVPKSLQHRKYPKRVIIHPETARPEKTWPREKFIELAFKLKQEGYDPQFVVSPQEASHWQDLSFPLHALPKLSDLAALLHESGFMIGNDSGVAHLASNVFVPTFALFIRPGVAKRWVPSFSSSYPLLPWLHLPGPKLKEKYWKQLISVSFVLKRFLKVAKRPFKNEKIEI